MPKSFTKRCCCHRNPVRVGKARWNEKRRRGGSMDLLCHETVYGAGFICMPYIPLLRVITL